MRGFSLKLEGKTFGRLTVLKQDIVRRNRSICWICKCFCGKEKSVSGTNLIRGESKSCGCLAKELSGVRNSKSKDITGLKFNKLTAIRFSRQVGYKYFWVFKCDCGVEKEMRKAAVTNSRSLSCGCLMKEINKVRFTGKNNPKWSNGGLTPVIRSARSSFVYQQWRKEVFKKDDYTCQGCLKRGGHDLIVDHIKPFSVIIKENNIDSLEKAMNCEELWSIENGRVLCECCHFKTPTYGLNLKLYV